ncbi:hypothetical protein P280DRAFT_458864 [Massarina eburnea CBS 473.64]|uniref:Trafficking protein particle complex II-specific subunit 65 IgD3 domain-containing protein n=1 Tax=Massarina eburnea CBS 473.64 TaxID=1395130 RepID=A0A6A6RPB7_9PLEO|nr:hypothetical protein P280DRAFT_458864 [Massarina eburnea CBS 473.64]
MPPRASAEFVESSVLEAVVPTDSDIDIADALDSWDGTNDDVLGSVLPFISQRQVLLFGTFGLSANPNRLLLIHRHIDELAPVYVVFRTPLVEDDTLKSYLARLAINVDAYAFSTAAAVESEGKAPPPKEQIFSETIKSSVEPIIVRHQVEDAPHAYVIWRVEVFISRPRGRFHRPAIYFHPTASLKPAERSKNGTGDDEYLPSGVPTALNLLQSFESDAALRGINPRLSALRINKIAPGTPVAKELTRPVRTGQRRLFRALPALIWRIRYSKVQSALSDLSLMASLDLEIAYVTGCSITVEEIQLSLKGGEVKPISDQKLASLVHGPGDQLTCLYKITPDLAFDGTPLFGRDGHVLSLAIKANVLVSDDCRPVVNIAWQTTVDFTTDLNTNLIKAAHRLSNPSAQLKESAEGHRQSDDAWNRVIHVTLTITGPPRVHVGDTFHWNVFIVNQLDKPRQLAVLVLLKRKREIHNPRPSTSSGIGHRTDKKDLLATAVVDENVVYAKQKEAKAESADLMCLTTDVRIGHLAPGACFTANLKFIALTAGVLSVDALRVVDLATNETSDIRDLPAIAALEKEL